MSISINTSDYKKTKKVEIDGVAFEVRPMNSSETLALMSIRGEMEGLKDGETADADTAVKALEKIENIYFAIFDKPSKAKKVLGSLGVEAWFEIYNQIMEQK